MKRSVQLPVVNESGNYEIRLESIGGLGANLCGKMLGELGLHYLGLNSVSFSSYGSEKTGTPVKAYIRYCEWEKEIRVHAPVMQPHLLCIFHDALMSDPAVFDGCGAYTRVVINTTKQIPNIPAGEIYRIPAQQIAMETHSRINVVMLGAMAKVMGFAALEDVNRICEDTLGKKYPHALAGNLEGIRRGYEEVEKVRTDNAEGKTDETSEETVDIERHGADGTCCARKEAKRHMQGEGTMGYETMPIGGINTHFGNSVISDLSPSRQGYFPIFLQEKCINCGLCDSACPDMVFQFGKGVYQGREMMVNQGLDYYHCKGCLRCVAVCPTQALVRGEEAEHPDKTWFRPDQDLLRAPDYYEKTGPDGYITSESYLTEKRMDGGEV